MSQGGPGWLIVTTGRNAEQEGGLSDKYARRSSKTDLTSVTKKKKKVPHAWFVVKKKLCKTKLLADCYDTFPSRLLTSGLACGFFYGVGCCKLQASLGNNYQHLKQQTCCFLFFSFTF